MRRFVKFWRGIGLGSNWEEPEFRQYVTCPLIYEPGISGALTPHNRVFGEHELLQLTP
jgi:hypothetical protein